jgi:hypothetical protein
MLPFMTLLDSRGARYVPLPQRPVSAGFHVHLSPSLGCAKRTITCVGSRKYRVTKQPNDPIGPASVFAQQSQRLGAGVEQTVDVTGPWSASSVRRL